MAGLLLGGGGAAQAQNILILVQTVGEFSDFPGSIDNENIPERGTVNIPIAIEFPEEWLHDPDFDTRNVTGDIVFKAETLGAGEHASATATEGEDYTAVSQTFTYTVETASPGARPDVISGSVLVHLAVPITADTVSEPDETFTLRFTVDEETGGGYRMAENCEFIDYLDGLLGRRTCRNHHPAGPGPNAGHGHDRRRPLRDEPIRTRVVVDHGSAEASLSRSALFRQELRRLGIHSSLRVRPAGQ